MFKLFSRKPDAQAAASERAKARQAKVQPSEDDPVRSREPDSQRDLMLSEHTVAWAGNLPPGLRPDELLQRYPRVANRLALCWSDVTLTSHLFNGLLVDTRGGRKGFPAPVLAELIRLRQHRNAARIAAALNEPVEPWALHSLTPSDR
jgi:hypothetical protein